MGWTKLTYWSGSPECCEECLLAPCQCCCYNETNGAHFDSADFPNLGGPCDNLGDLPEFNAYTCTAPTAATCANMDDQAAYDAYSCTGDLVGQQTMSLTWGVTQTLFSNPGGPTFTTLQVRFGVISCWPASALQLWLTHEPSGGGADIVSSIFISNSNTHYYTGVLGLNPMAGLRRLTKVEGLIANNFLPAGGTYDAKICVQKVT